MHKHQNIKLTSTEISALHENYLGDSMSICVLEYFLQRVDDQEIRLLLEHALVVTKQHVKMITGIFMEEGIAIPRGFTEQDVNLKAERLFSDTFYLFYLKHMTKGGLNTYGMLLPHIFREDILSFYTKCLTSTIELNNEVTRLLLKKGLAVRPPYIPYPKKVEFIQRQSFLAGFFGEKRPLTGLEITQLYSNIQTNELGVAMSLGFSQVAQSKKVRDFLLRGKDIAMKHIEIFRSYLETENLPAPSTWDHEVSTEKGFVFSDKLLIYHFGMMNYSGIGNYGVAISTSQRSDLVTSFSRLMAEVIKYSEDGVNIMIDEGWLEQPPLCADRNELTEEE